MNNFIGKFIGTKKIKEIKVIRRKTYLGNKVVKIILDDESKREYPLKMLELITFGL